MIIIDWSIIIGGTVDVFFWGDKKESATPKSSQYYLQKKKLAPLRQRESLQILVLKRFHPKGTAMESRGLASLLVTTEAPLSKALAAMDHGGPFPEADFWIAILRSVLRFDVSSRAQGHEKDPLGERCYAMPAAQFCQGEPLGKSDVIFSMRQTRESLLYWDEPWEYIAQLCHQSSSLCGFYSSDSVEQWTQATCPGGWWLWWRPEGEALRPATRGLHEKNLGRFMINWQLSSVDDVTAWYFTSSGDVIWEDSCFRGFPSWWNLTLEFDRKNLPCVYKKRTLYTNSSSLWKYWFESEICMIWCGISRWHAWT